MWGLVALALAEPPPSDATVIYYNARMALAEGEPLEAVKLWLLRNALADRTGEVSPHDADFGSVTWAALGELGICSDGHPTDEAGAGLWHLALHNWVVQNRTRSKPPKRPRPFGAFDVGRQQRFVSIGDVLSAPELAAVRLFRGRCLRGMSALVSAGEYVFADLSDPAVSARLLQYLLRQARSTLAEDRVRGMAAIDARLFDVHLQIAALAAREAEQEARDQARRGRQIGLSKGSVTAIGAEAPPDTLSPRSDAARVLTMCVTWPISEWMALSPDRRRFLFDRALAHGGASDALDRVSEGLVDTLVAAGEGEEVEAWIARRTADDAARDVIWSGLRGQQLMGLDPESGFRERAVIALHRGVDHLERDELPAALRSMAYALNHAMESQAADRVVGLSRRWLSYVAAQFEITDELLVTLQELVPSRDYAILLEDLMWSAAFHADGVSFDRGVDHQLGRGALERRLAVLQPLARGEIGRFTRGIRVGLTDSPSETLRFLDQMVQRLEREDADVRQTHLPTLARVRGLLGPLASQVGGTGRQARTAASVVQRCQAIEEGLQGLGPEATARDRARSLAPTGEVFAGSVRLAPADPLPWPFRRHEVTAPSIFTPLTLTPESWRDDAGDWVLGWRIAG